ncbi:hypothetical protein BaRGS_00015342 [Batillaria attramentaria]|uniref:Uncharacterized protein n=1 Tax=Batillaria attramentaria TaxID=370345 RepID=A0ABD0L214_9CAEN
MDNGSTSSHRQLTRFHLRLPGAGPLDNRAPRCAWTPSIMGGFVQRNPGSIWTSEPSTFSVSSAINCKLKGEKYLLDAPYFTTEGAGVCQVRDEEREELTFNMSGTPAGQDACHIWPAIQLQYLHSSPPHATLSLTLPRSRLRSTDRD